MVTQTFNESLQQKFAELRHNFSSGKNIWFRVSEYVKYLFLKGYGEGEIRKKAREFMKNLIDERVAYLLEKGYFEYARKKEKEYREKMDEHIEFCIRLAKMEKW